MSEAPVKVSMSAKVGAFTAPLFNAAHPVGTPVRYWPGFRQGEGRESRTRTPAWVIPSGHALVSVDGYPGGIALTHVDVIEREGGGDV